MVDGRLDRNRVGSSKKAVGLGGGCGCGRENGPRVDSQPGGGKGRTGSGSRGC